MGISLERSIFYKTLVKKHPKLFQQASNECWLICIPQDNSVKQCNLGDVTFIKSHFFKLSPFLKDHYVPVLNKDITDLEIQESCLRITVPNRSDKLCVKILFAHDAFNNDQQFYKILLVERPLMTPYLFDESIRPSENVNQDSLQPIISYSECLNYLKQIHSDTVDLILKKVACLVESQEIIFKSQEKSLCALDSVVSWAVSIFKSAAPDGRIEDEFLLENCIESLFVEPFADKFMSLLISDCALEAKIIEEKVKKMVKLNIDMRSLGSEAALDSFKVTPDVIELLNEMPLSTTPLDKAFIFKKVLDNIRSSLQSILEQSRSPFNLEPVKCLAPDDLVAATICMCIEMPSKVDMIFYNFTYIQTFGSRVCKMNELAHSLVTYEVALGYIRSFNAESFNGNRSSKRGIKGNKQFDEKSEISPLDTHCAASPSLSRSSLSEICHLNANDVTWYVDSIDSPPPRTSSGHSSHAAAAATSISTNRENSFKSFRSKNCHLDKQLAKIQEMIDDLSIASAPASTSKDVLVLLGEKEQTRGNKSSPLAGMKQSTDTLGAAPCKFTRTSKDQRASQLISVIEGTSSSILAESSLQAPVPTTQASSAPDTNADDLG